MIQNCSCEDSIFDGRGHCTRCGLPWPGYEGEEEAEYAPADDEMLACRLCNSALYVVSPGPNSLEVVAELIRGATGYSETVRDRALVLAAAVLESVGEK